jgi:hypothetical protein
MISKSRSASPTLKVSQAIFNASSTLFPVNSWYALSLAITYPLDDRDGRASWPNGSLRLLMQRDQDPCGFVVPHQPHHQPERPPA